MNQEQKPTIKQQVVDSINASLSRKIRNAGLRARGQMVAPRSGYDNVFTIYPNQKGDKKVVLKSDVLIMSFKENFLDGLSAWNLSGYNPRLVDLYSKLFKDLRPGSMYFYYDWVTTESYQGDNPKQVEIINGIKATLGLPDLRSASEISKIAEEAGFEVVKEEKGSLVNSLEKPWLERLKKKRSGYRRMYKATMVFEKLGFVLKSTVDDRKMRLKTVDYLIKGGETGIFSPMHVTLCRKPGKPSQP